MVDMVAMLVRQGLHAQGEINVLTFYNGQRALIARKLTAAGLPEVAAISVDSMQGREEDVIILSCVRTDRGSLGFLTDPRRVNVAISRAKEHLVVVGDPEALGGNRMWSEVLRRLTAHSGTRDYRDVMSDARALGPWRVPYRECKDREAKARNETLIMGLMLGLTSNKTPAGEAAAEGAGGAEVAAPGAVGVGGWEGGGVGGDAGFWEEEDGSDSDGLDTVGGGAAGGAQAQAAGAKKDWNDGWSDEEEEVYLHVYVRVQVYEICLHVYVRVCVYEVCLHVYVRVYVYAYG